MATVITADDSVVEVSVSEQRVDINVLESIVEVISAQGGPQGPRGSQILSGVGAPSIVIGLIGDQYIDTTNGYLYGPKTELGWGAGVLLGNGLKISDVSYVHIQFTPASTWTIDHTLGFVPNATFVDLSGNAMEGDYQYTTSNQIVVSFSESVDGVAYLS